MERLYIDGIEVTKTLVDRFESKVYPEPNTGCWLWAGPLNFGYGQFGIKGVTKRAHRVSYQIYKGEIPKGLFVCHTCDERGCVNPDHLWLGTNKENLHDMMKKGRGRKFTKLTVEQVLELRQNTLKQKEYAEKFGVTREAVCLALNRKNWKHIP